VKGHFSIIFSGTLQAWSPLTVTGAGAVMRTAVTPPSFSVTYDEGLEVGVGPVR